MTPHELEANYKELGRLAEELRAATNTQESDKLQRILAQLGYVLASMGKMVAETKGQVDEITYRERNRDRAQTSIRDERAIRFFAQLKPEDRERLVQETESATPNVSVKDFSDEISNRARIAMSWSVVDLMQTLGQWYSYLSQRETEEDVAWVANVLIDSNDPSMRDLFVAVDAANPNSTFTLQLKRLLRCAGTLGVTYKAEQLVTRNERQFGYATVSTDLRPIFDGKVEATPVYGVVVHNLLIGMNDGGTFRAIGLTLTSRDILNLADVLNRAYKKEQTLRQSQNYKLLPRG